MVKGGEEELRCNFINQYLFIVPDDDINAVDRLVYVFEG